MLSNTLSIIEMTIQHKMNKNIDSIALTNFFNNYRKNMWIYPGVLKRKFSLSIPEIYDFLSEFHRILWGGGSGDPAPSGAPPNP